MRLWAEVVTSWGTESETKLPHEPTNQRLSPAKPQDSQKMDKVGGQSESRSGVVPDCSWHWKRALHIASELHVFLNEWISEDWPIFTLPVLHRPWIKMTVVLIFLFLFLIYVVALAPSHILVLIHPAFTLSKRDLFSLASYFSPFASAFHPPSSVSQMLPETVSTNYHFFFTSRIWGERVGFLIFIYI